MKQNRNITAQLNLRTNLRSGNLASDACYADRNYYNLDHLCGLGGDCYKHEDLQRCLSVSGEPKWWTWDGVGISSQEEACRMTWAESKDIKKIKAMGCWTA